MSDLTDELGAKVDDLALELLGEPNRKLSTKTTWRYGSKGSLAIEVSGHAQGLWYDHEAGEGGGAFQLICREKGFSDWKDADAWARQWLRWPAWKPPLDAKPTFDISALLRWVLRAKPERKPDSAPEVDKERDAKRQLVNRLWDA